MKTFDPKCMELAEYFLADFTRVTEEESAELARLIQTAIEDHLENVEFEGRYRP